MNVVRVGQIVGIMALPSLAFAAAAYLPRGVDALMQLMVDRRAARNPPPPGPPIQHLPAHLRRLIRQHHAAMRSPSVTIRAPHLRALEGPVADTPRQPPPD